MAGIACEDWTALCGELGIGVSGERKHFVFDHHSKIIKTLLTADDTEEDNTSFQMIL